MKRIKLSSVKCVMLPFISIALIHHCRKFPQKAGFVMIVFNAWVVIRSSFPSRNMNKLDGTSPATLMTQRAEKDYVKPAMICTNKVIIVLFVWKHMMKIVQITLLDVMNVKNGSMLNAMVLIHKNLQNLKRVMLSMFVHFVETRKNDSNIVYILYI